MPSGSHLLVTTSTYAYLEPRFLAAGPFERGEVERKSFPDGEQYRRLACDVWGRDVVLLGGTPSELVKALWRLVNRADQDANATLANFLPFDRHARARAAFLRSASDRSFLRVRGARWQRFVARGGSRRLEGITRRRRELFRPASDLGVEEVEQGGQELLGQCPFRSFASRKLLHPQKEGSLWKRPMVLLQQLDHRAIELVEMLVHRCPGHPCGMDDLAPHMPEIFQLHGR